MLNENTSTVRKIAGVVKEAIDLYKYLLEQLSAEHQKVNSLKANIKKEMQSIEKLFKEFEELYRKTDEECCELLSLVDWYTNFELMHKELFVELKRRVEIEQEIEKEVESYRQVLKEQFEQEVKQRKKFADELQGYLPAPLLPLVAEHPIKYQVYPINQKSALLNLTQEAPELFQEPKKESTPVTKK
eukprot:TRINITY_DN12545_c0_g6_i4.p4 TRINITY_DN12545_c0_g6~~TRINITY_DN12545_c0_g6_i4.p4  ORF type:complete len:187 (+),score=80.20 TRINITY_DN12545_c0_g6_i4:1125-1685(+)